MIKKDEYKLMLAVTLANLILRTKTYRKTNFFEQLIGYGKYVPLFSLEREGLVNFTWNMNEYIDDEDGFSVKEMRMIIIFPNENKRLVIKLPLKVGYNYTENELIELIYSRI